MPRWRRISWHYEKCHRMLNAVEPGTDIPIHRHPTKDESFVILRGKVRSTTFNDDGSVIESVVLSAEEGRYGVDIPKGVWHKLHKLISLYLQTKAFYKSARIAKILNEKQWRLGVTGIWKG